MKYILESPVRGMISEQKFKTFIHWRNGVLITDEPEKLGGQDLGPDPYTLLLSSLVACTLATLRMYIAHKGLTIGDITVEANMYQEMEENQPVMHIERSIQIADVRDPVLQVRLIRIAENCPISKILKSTTRISTRLNT
ncbi:MAG: OsmC family peroxiredoxin [Sphingobacteriales bacterium]|nr:MAG: OsmC family peroxiredoxin [Sphingobacteriales bacterium]